MENTKDKYVFYEYSSIEERERRWLVIVHLPAILCSMKSR